MDDSANSTGVYDSVQRGKEVESTDFWCGGCVLGGYYGIICAIAIEGGGMMLKHRDKGLCNSRGLCRECEYVVVAVNIGSVELFAR